MKSVEERLRELPQMADSFGLQADEKLKRRILRAAREKKPAGRRVLLRRAMPVMAALIILIGAAAVAVPALRGPEGPQPTGQPLIESFSAGSNVPAGEKLALDVPKGSITIQSSSNANFRSIWARASGGNFPVIGVKGRYYRLLTNPTAIGNSMLGNALGAVDTFTGEPALAGRSGIVSNAVAQGENVYAVSGMNGALVAARMDGQMRVFQRVSFGDSALVGGESLGDTLRADSVTALELSGVGAVTDAGEAKKLMNILTANASFLRAGSSETNQSLLIQLRSGIVLQMAVNGEKLMACGTWACPEFFDAFQEALQ